MSRRLNDYLAVFNAGFTITETEHAYPGGVATSSYQFVINDTAVDLGDSRRLGDWPSFKDTLSAGDRTTLAIAFFSRTWSEPPQRTESLSFSTTHSTVRMLSVFARVIGKNDAFRAGITNHLHAILLGPNGDNRRGAGGR